MATITKNDADRMGAFMREFWPFMKKYFTPEDADEYWDNILDDANRLADKYLNVPTTKALIVAFLKDREKEYKNEQAAKKARGTTCTSVGGN